MISRFLIATALAGAVALPASAATFLAEHGVTPTACNVATSTGPFVTGQVITYTPQACLGGYNVFLDTTARTITVAGASAPYADYRFSEFTITGITGVTITGLSVVQLTPLFDTTANPVPSVALSFTGNSIGILFGTRSDSTPIFDFSTSGGEAIFAYTAVGAAIPEPASWAMLIAGFGLVGAAARRRRTAALI